MLLHAEWGGEAAAQTYAQRYREEGEWTPGLAANSAVFLLCAFALVPLLPGPQVSRLCHGAAVGLPNAIQPQEAAVLRVKSSAPHRNR